MVGVTYLCLAVWCALQPVGTSQAIGFQIASGSGHSEYLTVYGGLQFGLGLEASWASVRSVLVFTRIFIRSPYIWQWVNGVCLFCPCLRWGGITDNGKVGWQGRP